MIERTLAIAAIALGLLVGGCQEAAQPDARGANPEKYDRDRSLCQGQVDEYMQSRRRVDDASAGSTFANTSDRGGRDGLSNQMANYGDGRNADRFMASCMEGRGWPQAQKAWWQRIGG